MSATTLQSLPFDVFEHICSYLALRDVHQLMLTCKSFYSYSHNNIVYDKIKIRVNRLDCLASSVSTKLQQLLKGEMYFGTIELIAIEITELSKEFLTKFGPRIRNITYHNDSLRISTIVQIFAYLHDIRSLKITFSTDFDERETVEFWLASKYEDMCHKFKNLTEFVLHRASCNMVQFCFEHLLNQVTSIKALSLTNFDAENISGIYKFLAKQIKTIQHLEIYTEFSHFERLVNLGGINLRSLYIGQGFRFHRDLHHFEKFCKSQSSLTNLKIGLNFDYGNPIKIICDNLTNLQTLQLQFFTYDLVPENYNCILQLKMLKTLDITQIEYEEAKEFIKITMPNLRCLSLKDPDDFETFELLSTNFINLEELHLTIDRVGILHFNCIQLIFKNLCNLKHLSFTFGSEAYQDETEVETICKISNLNKLEVLKISTFFGGFPGVTINDVADLRNLKELYLEGNHIRNSSYEEYNKLMVSNLKLEKFTIENLDLLDNNLIELLTTNCKMLTHLKIMFCQNLKSEIKDRIFENCRFLKTLDLDVSSRLFRGRVR